MQYIGDCFVVQIINYLTMHAHHEMLAHRPVLPPTIIDQIRLWEIERDRFQFTDGVLYSQFISQNEFEILRDFARVRHLDMSSKGIFILC